MQVVVIRVVGEADGAVWTSDGTTSVDPFELPWFAIQNACAEVLYVLCCGQSANVPV